MSNGTETDRLFAGLYPCGIVYADRHREKHGDYARLAFLPYASLVLDVEKDCPPQLAERIRKDAAQIQAKRGQPFRIAGNMIITLGS